MLSLAISTINLSDVLLAHKRIAPWAIVTPCKKSNWLARSTGAEVWLKLENLQVSGSFKLRGALNALFEASERQVNKVFTASSGNHGLAVATAAQYAGCEATICLPQNASRLKFDRLRSFNVGLIQHGGDCQEAEAYAQRLAKEKKAFYLSPYNNLQVIAGQATLALEMLTEVPNLTTLIASVGGGGLISGVGLAAKAINPSIRIIGVSAAKSPALHECVRAGRVIPVMIDETIADGLAGNIDPDSITLPLSQRVVDDWVIVDEQDIASTILDFANNEGMIIEGAAATAIAAVSKNLIDLPAKDKVGVVVCGGNIETAVWHQIFRNNL